MSSGNGQPSGGPPPRPREWREQYDPITDEQGNLLGFDRDEARNAMAEIEGILFRLGGGFVIVAEREQLTSGEWVTTGVKVQYRSWVPPVSRAPEVNMGDPSISQRVAEQAASPPPEAVEPTVEPPPEPEFCKSDGCVLPKGHEGDHMAAPAPVSATAGTEPEAELEPAAQTD